MKHLFETILMMIAFLYGGLISAKFLWLFPIAMIIFLVRCHIENKQKENRK